MSITCPTCGTTIIPPRVSITEGQQRAYHAKVNAIVSATGGDRDAIKAGILAEASEQFGRELSSSSELTASEAHWVLDRLDEHANAVRT